MGLDMYLSKKTYVKQWEHQGDDSFKVEVTKKVNRFHILNRNEFLILKKKLVTGVNQIKFTIGLCKMFKMVLMIVVLILFQKNN